MTRTTEEESHGGLVALGKLHEEDEVRAEPQRKSKNSLSFKICFPFMSFFDFVFHPFKPIAKSKLNMSSPYLENKALISSVS